MFERILVPLDGSARAERAIAVAVRLARASGGSIILLSAVAPPASPGKFSSLDGHPRGTTDEAFAEATEYLKIQADALQGLPIERYVLVGLPATAILEAVQSLRATLILMCSHGWTGFTRWMLGSVAEKVIRHAPIPLLVLRNGGPEPGSVQVQEMRTLVALDGSPVSEAILDPAVALTAALAQAAGQRGALHLLQVVAIPSGYGKFRSGVDGFYEEEMREQAKQEAEQYMAAVAKRLTEGIAGKVGLAVTWRVVIEPDVTEALVQQAREDTCTLISLATHGRNGVAHWMLGSTTERVLHTTTLPIFIVRSAGATTQASSPVKAAHPVQAHPFKMQE